MAIDLNSSPWMLQGLDITPPKKRPEWVQGADSDGSALLRDPLFENRTVTARLRVSPQATMDAALGYVSDLTAQLEEAERQADGVPMVWLPSGSSRQMTMYCLSGEVEQLPVVVSGDDFGWFRSSPVLNVRFDCKPFLYGAPVTRDLVTSSAPTLQMVLDTIEGTVNAEARLVLTDLATQSRRWVEGGLQSRFYDGATNLLLDTSQLTITGFAGTSQTRAGSFSTNVFRGALGTQPTAVCGTGNKTHIGTYRVIGRVFAAPASGNPADIQVRFSYQDGSGVFRAGAYTSSPVANFYGRVDLGTITITQAQQGTQQWSGRVEAYSVAAGDTLDVDFLWLVPVDEGYFKVAATYNYQSGALVARDEFTGTTAGGLLNGRTAPLAGGTPTWATSGATGDFAFSDNGFGTGSEEVSRQTGLIDTGYGRLARVGSTSYTDVEVGVKFLGTGSTNQGIFGPIARYVDDAHFAGAEVVGTDYGFGPSFRIVVALGLSSWIQVASTPFLMSANTPYVVRLVVYSSGTIVGRLEYASGGLIAQLKGTHSALATGGSLATGTPGFRDLHINLGTNARYDNFYAALPAPEPIAVNSGKAAEVRFDGYQRQDASSVWGPMAPRGKPLFLPPAGVANRSTRITCLAHRNDLSSAAWEPVTDSLQAQAIYQSRYLAVPR